MHSHVRIIQLQMWQYVQYDSYWKYCFDYRACIKYQCTFLSEHYKFFSTTWGSTIATDKVLENLKARLAMKEEKINSEETEVALKAVKKKSYCNVAHTT